jgi:hypothetical protein
LLRSRFKGAVIEPGRDGWDAATQALNLTVVQQPALSPSRPTQWT